MSALETVLDLAQYLTFFVAEEEYAVGVLRVREIVEYQPVTRVPKAPSWIRGVVNLRGSVVPVVDLATKFGLKETAPTKRTCLVIVEVSRGDERAVMGLLADAVNQVIDLKPGDVCPPPPFGTRVRVDYLLGMGKVGEKFVLILDIDRVLSPDEALPSTEEAAPLEKAKRRRSPSREGAPS